MKLKGEGDIETVTRKRARIECENCGEPAHYKHTFLLPNARSNPASSGYRGDDISWCSDYDSYSCENSECQEYSKDVDGYNWCGTYAVCERFGHMFLRWEETVVRGDK